MKHGLNCVYVIRAIKHGLLFESAYRTYNEITNKMSARLSKSETCLPLLNKCFYSWNGYLFFNVCNIFDIYLYLNVLIICHRNCSDIFKPVFETHYRHTRSSPNNLAIPK